MQHRRVSRGFSIIELLVYVSLFGLILTGVITSAYPLITGAEKLSARVVSESEAAFVFQKIGWALYSSSVQAITDGSSLVISFTTPVGHTISFRENVGAIEIKTDTGTWNPITASRVVFSNFAVVHTIPPVGVTNAPHLLQITFIIDGTPHSQIYNVMY